MYGLTLSTLVDPADVSGYNRYSLHNYNFAIFYIEGRCDEW